MLLAAKLLAKTSILLLAFLCLPGFAQGPDPSQNPGSTAAALDKTKSETVLAPNTQEAKPAATPEPDFWHRETLTGDWNGARTRWKESGVELEFKLSQFYQAVTSGGERHDHEFNGKFEMLWKFDLGKVAGWKWWSAEIKSEWRFGGPALGGTGAINFVNTAEVVPGSNGSTASITALNFTRLIPKDLKKGDLYAVSFGRFNLLDLIDEEFFGGSGTERFFNIAQIGPLTVLRQVPLITNLASFAYIKGGQPRFTLAVIDPNDHSLNPGIKDLFADGVTLSPGYIIPTKHFSKTAKHSFGGAITTKKYTPFDATRQVIIPGPAINPVQPKRGSWSINYDFRQYIVERGKRDGWGFFAQVSFADKATSPITTFLDLGLGGNGLFKSRPKDEFGIAYAYTDLSKVLKDNIDLVTQGGRRPIPERQVEMFYNFHLTPWLRLTADLQIIRPVKAAVNTAVVPGARLQVMF